MKPEAKHLLITAGCYILYVIAAMILSEADPGGPCTPGLGFGLMVLLMPIGVIGFLASAILMYLGHTNLKWSIWFHLAVPVSFFMLGAFAI